MSVTLLSDTFTDADNTSLAAHTMDVGSGWTANVGTFKILFDKATPNSNVNGDTATCDAGVADYILTCDVTPENGAPGNEDTPALFIRFQDTSNWFAVQSTSGGQLCEIYENKAGSVSLKATSFGGFTSGISYAHKVVVSGSSITVYINGLFQVAYTSATDFSTATKVGIRVGVGGSPPGLCTFDNFLVQQPTGDAAGSATVSGAASTTAGGAGTVVGSATVSGAGASNAQNVGSSTGSAAVSAVGTSTAASVGSSTGSGISLGVSNAGSVGASAGSASVHGVGTTTSGIGVGAATGSGVATGAGGSVDGVNIVASASGTATVIGAGASHAAGSGHLAGSSSVHGVWTGIAIAIGSASGAGLVQGAGSQSAAVIPNPYRPQRVDELNQ